MNTRLTRWLCLLLALAAAGPVRAQQADEFTGAALSPFWSFVNPLADASAAPENGALRLSLPQGPSHDPWYPQNTAPRLLQNTPDAPFRLEARFLSRPTLNIQGQGFVVEGRLASGSGTPAFLRFDVFSVGGRLRGFAALVSETEATVLANAVVAEPVGTGPVTLRLERMGTGAAWVFGVRVGEGSWQTVATFEQGLVVERVGVEATNWSGDGASAPAYTAQIDYFRNLDDPNTPPPNPGPTVAVWYGDTQLVGAAGQPQTWFNLLGNVADPDGVAALTYRLNDGPEAPLSRGPDNRRLTAPGDFNAEIAFADLRLGDNTVVLTARDAKGAVTTYSVTLHYAPATPPLPYAQSWSGSPQSGAQVVDGRWAVTPEGTLRTAEIGYDRLVALGDLGWGDYEVTVPVTIHAIDARGYDPISTAPALGVVLRWREHVAWSDAQPRHGWLPLGAIGWYRWPDGVAQRGQLEILGNGFESLVEDAQALPLQAGGTYWFKMRVETLAGVGGRYRLKVWEAGQPEPAAWGLTLQEALDDPQSGSVLLLAHWVDASFGAVQIAPLGAVDTTPPTLAGVTVTTTATGATLRWTTSEPALSVLAYGPTASVSAGSVASGPPPTTTHEATLTSLAPATTYHYRLTATDAAGNAATPRTGTFTTGTATPPPSLQSDEFTGAALSPFWSFVNPLADASAAPENGALRLSLPQGPSHDPWYPQNTAPRLLQNTPDAPFRLEARFLSRPTLNIQGQGFVVEGRLASGGGTPAFLRFDVFSVGGRLRGFAALVSETEATVLANAVVAEPVGTGPVTLRLERMGTGAAWVFGVRVGEGSWQTVATFEQALVVERVGVEATNWSGDGASAPAYTAQIDYFRNLDDPNAPAGMPPPAGDASVARADDGRLSAAYPNPFNPTTTFTLALEASQPVRVAVYDVLGRRVALLHDGPLAAGTPHAFRFDASGLPSGLYVVRATGAHFAAQRTLVLAK